MNRLMKAGSVAMTVGTLAAVSIAGPLRSNVVSDDATWLIHVNVESLVDSTIGGMLLSEGGPIDIDQIGEMQDKLGLDPLQEVFGITAYGIGDDESSFVAVVRGSIALEDALDQLIEKAGDACKTFDEGSKTIHEFGDGGDSMFGCLTKSGGRNGRTLTVSHDLDRLMASIERLDGRGRSDLVHGRGPGENSFLYISAGELPGMGQHGPASMIFKAAKGVTVDIGESAEFLYIHGAMKTANAEKATIVLQAVEGLKAMTMLLSGANEETAQVAQLLAALNIGIEGDTLTASFQIPGGMLAGLLAEYGHEDQGADSADDDEDWDDEDEDDDDRLQELQEKLERLERILREKGGERRH